MPKSRELLEKWHRHTTLSLAIKQFPITADEMTNPFAIEKCKGKRSMPEHSF